MGKTDALCNVSVMAMFSFGRAIPHSNEYENRPIYCFIMYSKPRGSSYTPKYNSTAEKTLSTVVIHQKRARGVIALL